MQRSNIQSIGEVIAQMLRENGMERPLMEKRIVEAWPEVLGPTVARYTGDIRSAQARTVQLPIPTGGKTPESRRC